MHHKARTVIGLRVVFVTAALALAGLTGCVPGGGRGGPADADPAASPDGSPAGDLGPDRGSAPLDAAVDGAPDLGADAMADASRDAIPDAIPDAMPDAMPDAAPDAMPDAAPEACEAGAVQRRGCGLEGAGTERRVCVDGVFEPWGPCEGAPVCVEDEVEDEPCGVAGNGTRARRCVGGQWSAWGSCDDPDRACEDGAIEEVPCGLNRRGSLTRQCVDGRFGPSSPCDDPDVCVDGGEERAPCGLNDRGSRLRACADGAWGDFAACVDPDDCVDGTPGEAIACGINGRGAARPTCVEGAFGLPGACVDPDVCADGAEESVACGLNGRGRRLRVCAEGEWGAFGACADPDVCLDGARDDRACGLNGRGAETRTCDDGQWGPYAPCVDADACLDGDSEARVCGLNDRAEQRHVCEAGRWTPFGPCDDADVCVDGAAGSQVCGRNGRGQRNRRCAVGQWGPFGACIDPDQCLDGAEQARMCGLNGRGASTRRCLVGAWGDYGPCDDPDVCLLGEPVVAPCGLNGRGALEAACVDGQIQPRPGAQCFDPDQCVDGDTIEADCPGGTRTRTCVGGLYAGFGPCLPPPCAPDDAECLACRDRFEANQSGFDAREVQLGRTDDVRLCRALDESDWYAFIAAEPSVVTLDATWDRAGPPLVIRGGYGVGGEGIVSPARPTAEGSTQVFLSDGRNPSGIQATFADVGDEPAPVDYAFDLAVEPFDACTDGTVGEPGDDCYPCRDPLEPSALRDPRSVAPHSRFVAGVCDGGYSDSEDEYLVRLPRVGTLTVSLAVEASLLPDAVTLDLSGVAGVESPDPFTRRAEVDRPITLRISVAGAPAVRYRLTVDFDGGPCFNGVDDDGDGRLDLDDPGCVDLSDDDEADPVEPPACDNGLDDDGDGLIDFPDDIDCAAAGWPAEVSTCLTEAPVARVTAADLEPDGGGRLTRLRVSTVGRGDDYGALACAAGGPDVPLLVEVDRPSRLTIVLTPDPAYANALSTLSVRGRCDAVESEDGCSAQQMFNALTLVVEPGVYGLIVDGGRPEDAIEGELLVRLDDL